MQIIDGKKLSEQILTKVRAEVVGLTFKPVFCDILVGGDPASLQYVQMKKSSAESVGVSFHKANFSADIITEDLIKEIKNLNIFPNMCGIIVQLPLPTHIDQRAVLDAIDPSLDVDCLGSVASEKFYNTCLRRQDKENSLKYPTALACMAVLDSLNLDLNNKNIVVLGQGMLVGKPVSALLNFRSLLHTTIDSSTTDKEKIIKEADIIISGIGMGKYITGDMIKKGAVLIDAGTSESTGSIVGDVDIESVKDIASYVSPVPGGVGPVTVAILLNNVLTVAKSLGKTRDDFAKSHE